MAARHPRSTSIGEYQAFRINTAATNQGLPTTASSQYPALDLGHGVFLGAAVVNTPGVGCTLLLYNGLGNLIASVKPAINVTLEFNCVCDNGLFYTYSGSTLGDITLAVLPCAV